MSKRAKRQRRAASELARRQDAALEKVWAQVPAVRCKGLCWTTCTPVDLTRREHDRILERHSVNVPLIKGPYPGRGEDSDWLKDRPADFCPALTEDKRCSVYADRPTTCRIWGATEDLPCMHGCQVDGEPLDIVEMAALGAESIRAGGSSPYRDRQVVKAGVAEHPTGDQVRRAARMNPAGLAVYRAGVADGYANDVMRALYYGQLTAGSVKVELVDE